MSRVRRKSRHFWTFAFADDTRTLLRGTLESVDFAAVVLFDCGANFISVLLVLGNQDTAQRNSEESKTGKARSSFQAIEMVENQSSHYLRLSLTRIRFPP